MTFVKGQSGNPAGRRPGSRNKVTEIVEGLSGDNVEEMANELMRLVRLGNPAAVRTYFDRIWPKRRGAPVALELPEMRSAADLPAALAAIIQGLAAGDLSVEELETLTRSVERMGRILQIADAAARLAQAEARFANSEARRAAGEARIAVLEAKIDALEKGLGGRFVRVDDTPRQTPDLAPATDLQAPVASATDLQAGTRSRDGAQRHPGTVFPDVGAVQLNPGYQTSPLAPATNLQEPAVAPAADLQARGPAAVPNPPSAAACPDRDDDWMRNFLGPQADVPWSGYGGDHRRAA